MSRVHPQDRATRLEAAAAFLVIALSIAGLGVLAQPDGGLEVPLQAPPAAAEVARAEG